MEIFPPGSPYSILPRTPEWVTVVTRLICRPLVTDFSPNLQQLPKDINNLSWIQRDDLLSIHICGLQVKIYSIIKLHLLFIPPYIIYILVLFMFNVDVH